LNVVYQLNSKVAYFRTYLYIFFSFAVNNSLLTFVQTSVIQPIYTDFIIAKLIESFRAL